jgi:hypothetical protein
MEKSTVVVPSLLLEVEVMTETGDRIHVIVNPKGVGPTGPLPFTSNHTNYRTFRRFFCRRRHQPSRPPLASTKPGIPDNLAHQGIESVTNAFVPFARTVHS